MARVTKPLSQTEIKSAKPQDKEYTLRDGDGLYLRIKKNGTKLWLFDYYRPITKKRTNMGFGSFPEVSLADARRKREESRSLLTRGIDPQDHLKEQRVNVLAEAANTFSSISESWMALKKTRVTADHAFDIWRSLERDVLPLIGDLPITAVKAQTVITALQPVQSRGNLETLKRLIQRINEIMTYAVNSGFIDANPVAGVRQVFQQPKKKHMPSITPEQLPELMSALATARINLQTQRLIEWSLHTMSRPGEAAGARWAEIDYDEKLWRIPGNRMKAGREHIVPLTHQSLAILEFMQPISGHREFIFPGVKNPKVPMNSQTANMALKRMGFGGTLVAHGLRSLASTALNEQGFEPDLVEAALAHIDKNEVRRAYNRATYIERRKKMMEWWSDKITSSK
ncbi:integrase domain-containing protein [Oceanimonas baumannii]|uniref:integrase domain-containing protein n=1 Tax=Oceanimonas baumannii TaxID=129578 RepID=UPI003A909CDD